MADLTPNEQKTMEASDDLQRQALDNEREADRLEVELEAKAQEWKRQHFPEELERIKKLREAVPRLRAQGNSMHVVASGSAIERTRQQKKSCRVTQPSTAPTAPDALTVACPLCSAAAGAPCIGTGGQPHAMRVRKAQGAA